MTTYLPFLRPWFLILLFLPFIFRRYFSEKSDFERIVAAPFWKMFKISVSDFYRKGHFFLKAAAYFLLVVALSGPVSYKSARSIYSEKKGAVIVWDVSYLNLLQKEQAVQISEYLKKLTDVETGFVVYDAYPYLVSPLSKDFQIIQQNLFQINPTIMPSPKMSDLVRAERFANDLLKDAGFSDGKIVIFNHAGIFEKGRFSSDTIKEDGLLDIPVDFGIYFLVLGALCILLSELLRRIGFLFCLLPFILPCSFAFAASYQNDWQGVKAYRAGSFHDAAAFFEKGQDTEALYNLGNALAKSGRIKEAIAVYEAFLKNHPDHKDAAFNLAYLKKQQEQNPENDTRQKDAQSTDEQDGQEMPMKLPIDQLPEDDLDDMNEETDDAESPRFIDAPTRGDQWLYSVPDEPMGLLKERLRRQYLKQGGKK